MVVRGGSHFCQSPKSGGGGVRSFFIKTRGRANTFFGKNTKIPQPSLPKKKRTFPKSKTKFCRKVSLLEVSFFFFSKTTREIICFKR